MLHIGRGVVSAYLARYFAPRRNLELAKMGVAKLDVHSWSNKLRFESWVAWSVHYCNLSSCTSKSRFLVSQEPPVAIFQMISTNLFELIDRSSVGRRKERKDILFYCFHVLWECALGMCHYLCRRAAFPDRLTWPKIVKLPILWQRVEIPKSEWVMMILLLSTYTIKTSVYLNFNCI